MDRWRKLFNGDEIVNRWRSGELLSEAEEIVAKSLIEDWRDRLFDLSWFMRCLNEHIARLANQEDGCNGRFWAAPAHPCARGTWTPVHRRDATNPKHCSMNVLY